MIRAGTLVRDAALLGKAPAIVVLVHEDGDQFAVDAAIHGLTPEMLEVAIAQLLQDLADTGSRNATVCDCCMDRLQRATAASAALACTPADKRNH